MGAALALGFLLAAAFPASAVAPGPAPAETRARERPLRVLTLNTAGIPIVHHRPALRARAIAARVAEERYDVAAFQEAWLDRYGRILARNSGMPYHARAKHRTFMGDGLIVLSRYPIVESRTRVFWARSRRMGFDGESVVRRAVQLARVALPWGPLDVYNTHLSANYEGESHHALRLIQVLELAEQVLGQSSGRPALILGDMNMRRGTGEAELLKGLLGLSDVCLNGEEELCGETLSGEGRIDYIFVPGKKDEDARARAVFTEPVPKGGGIIAYSDHLGLEATLPRVAPISVNPRSARFRAALAALETQIRSEQEHPKWGRDVRRALKRIEEWKVALGIE